MSGIAFTTEQLRAVDIERRHLDACVTAGPGSGKTTVLVEYFRRLVANGTNPQRVLAITFTEKAAANMRRKLAETFQEQSDIRASLERAWVSTVHGFCARLLKENAIFAGVDPDFVVADERDSWRLEQESINHAISSMFSDAPARLRALIRGLASWEFEDAILSVYDAIRGAGQTLDEVAQAPPPVGATRGDLVQTLDCLRADPLAAWNVSQKTHMCAIREDLERIVSAPDTLAALRAVEAFSGNLNSCKKGSPARALVKDLKERQLPEFQYRLITEHFAQERDTLFEILRRFDCAYRARKIEAGLLDFADLEEYGVRLLEECPERRTLIRNQFDYILMDEFQDTNGQQSRLMDLVRRPDAFYAVGDINQSIFGFRHAEPEVFRRYRSSVQQRGCRLIDLTGNFRSRADILRAVETIVGAAEGIEPRALVPERVFPQACPVSVELMSVLADDGDEALRNEGRWVAHRILELLSGTGAVFGFKDVAVLVRNTEVIRDFTEAFEAAGIPYVVDRGKGFFEGREVRDLFHLLRVIANPRDEVSLAAVLRSPFVYASDEALLALHVLGDNIGDSLIALGDRAGTALAESDYEKLIRFRGHLRRWRVRREYVTLDRLLLEAIDALGYRSEGGDRGWANIEKFLAQARKAAASSSLDDFIEQVALMRGDNMREADAPPEDAADAVKVMTVHSAKGLEFPIVFVAALHKGIENKPPLVGFSREFGLGARWRNPVTAKEKSDSFLHAINEERKTRETHESHRLLYVAMTRAEQHLVLSFSGTGRKVDNWARRVVEALAIEHTVPANEVQTRMSPEGLEWKLRLVVTNQPPNLIPRPSLPGSTAEVEPLSRPQLTDQQDTNATVTALATFAKCPRQYYLAEYLGLVGRTQNLEPGSATSKSSSPASVFGTTVHKLLSSDLPQKADPAEAALVDVFRRSTLGQRAARASRVEREFDFLMAVDGLVIRGQIDLWFEEAGELIIVDYKTDTVTALEAHRRAEDYAVQLRLYALALERYLGRAPDRAWLYFLRPNTPIKVDLAPSLLDSPEQIVREFQDAQATLQFPLREAEHCLRCEFFGELCPARYERRKHR
ncbi:MAG: UvrD-helicase domain-containing protein [Acidobacteriia bacterium]|nr:UvrD-helicase domain-containing protein [Terriglobia bacterium]